MMTIRGRSAVSHDLSRFPGDSPTEGMKPGEHDKAEQESS